MSFAKTRRKLANEARKERVAAQEKAMATVPVACLACGRESEIYPFQLDKLGQRWRWCPRCQTKQWHQKKP